MSNILYSNERNGTEWFNNNQSTRQKTGSTAQIHQSIFTSIIGAISSK